MRLQSSTKPLATLSSADEIYLIDENDLIWLLRCTRDILQSDLDSFPSDCVPECNLTRANIERIDQQLELMNQ